MVTHSPMALSHLKFRHLMLVLHLAEHGTLHKAARYLSISQPAATAMLSDLEALIGLRLFDRSRRGVAPTEQARALLDKARTILNEFSDFTLTIGRIAQGRGRVLRIGVIPQAFASYLPGVIERFRAIDGCAVKTAEATARQLLVQLLEGQLDCVVGRLPNEGLGEGHDVAELNFVSLYDEEICVVVGAAHKAAQRRKLSYPELAAREWVLQRRDSSVRRALNEAFLRRGIPPPDPVVETTNYIQSLTVVSTTKLFTVAPRRASEIQQRLGIVKILNFHLDIAPMQVCFINRKSAEGNQSMRRFRDCFSAAVACERA
jgi:DNA-binding transcriptional LysR family regulator